MRFDLSETQQLLKSSARQFLTAECPMAEVRRLMETEVAYDPGLWARMAEQGWTGIHFSDASEGQGMGLVEVAALMEEMGRALLPGPYLSTVLLAGTLLEAAGTAEQKQKYLVPIANGQARATLALLESSASWQQDAVRLQARREGSVYKLDGTKLFVPDASVSDFILCAARLGQELALFMTERGNTGVGVKPQPAIDSTRRLDEVNFVAAEVPPEDVIATGERARAALEYTLDVATVGLVAEMVGGMQKVLETSVDYAKTRKQFGKPIGQFQAIQNYCADMLVWTESARSAAYYAAWALTEQAPEAKSAVSVAKAYASDACREVGNRGIQIHGGMGFTWENDLHLYYRRAKASEIAFGDAAFHRERIARLVIDRAAPTR